MIHQILTTPLLLICVSLMLTGVLAIVLILLDAIINGADQ